MKKLYILIGLIVVYGVLAIAMNNKISKEKLEGKWTVKVTNAPNGYEDYVFDVKEDNGEYRVDIFSADARLRYLNRELTLSDGKLSGNIIIDGERVEITIWEEKGIVLGTARNSYIGTLPLTFSRPKD